MKEYYDMQMGDELELDEETFVLRVPGGWLYKFYEDKGGRLDHVHFVGEPSNTINVGRSTGSGGNSKRQPA